MSLSLHNNDAHLLCTPAWLHLRDSASLGQCPCWSSPLGRRDSTRYTCWRLRVHGRTCSKTLVASGGVAKQSYTKQSAAASCNWAGKANRRGQPTRHILSEFELGHSTVAVVHMVAAVQLDGLRVKGDGVLISSRTQGLVAAQLLRLVVVVVESR